MTLLLSEFAEAIGRSPITVGIVQSYNQYRVEIDGKLIGYDYARYIKDENNRAYILEQGKLFVEYLKHEKGLNNRRIAIMANTNTQPINTLSFGWKIAHRLLTFCIHETFLVEDFLDYYNDKQTKCWKQRLREVA